MRWRRQLSTRILGWVLAILLASTAVGFTLATLGERRQLDRQYQERALAIAQTFASMPSIRAAMARRGPADRRLVQRLAEQVRRRTGATYVVVIDRAGFRYSHPDSTLVGQRITERVVALDGRDHVGTDHGNLGTSANARAPLRSPTGAIVGEVSAGILERRVSGQLASELPSLLLYFACALGIGAVASLTLARRLKRSTFGLELDEIAALVQEREAMLHGIREGVITLDPAGRVTLINDEARRLIPLGAGGIGRRLDELVPAGRLRDVLSGGIDGRDQVVLTDEHVLVVNRMPVARSGRALGAVITLRDRTELEGLLRELDSVDSLTDALRAQQHEFSNRMHTVAGLIELGDHEGAARYALDVSRASGGLAEVIRERIESRELAAMLLAKTTIAAERGVELVLASDSRLVEREDEVATLVTVIGNLIDNAVDAAADGDGTRRVEVRLRQDGGSTVIEVTDSGPGIPPEVELLIFSDGFSTKPDEGDRHRGLGLALVHRLVRRSGGTIRITRDRGTTFTVVLPATRPAALGLEA
jgi:two-component system CitB family sensor kinase